MVEGYGRGLYNISVLSYNIVFTGVGLFTGLKWYKELQIRLYCRHVLLDHWTNRPVKQFWLNLLLRPWPLVSQARLLFILYGPSLPEGKNHFPDILYLICFHIDLQRLMLFGCCLAQSNCLSFFVCL